MSIKVGINGFGRIGRLVFRAGIVRDDIEIVAVNAPDKTPEQLAYVTKFDSVHGRFNGSVEVVDGNLVVNGKTVKVLGPAIPTSCPGASWALTTSSSAPASSSPRRAPSPISTPAPRSSFSPAPPRTTPRCSSAASTSTSTTPA